MEIKNLKTGNQILFGGEQFKRLLKLQETTGVKYFTKKDLAACVSVDKKTKTKTQQKVKKLGTNAKRKQKGGVLITADTVRKFPDRIDENGVTHTGESSETEECPVCFVRWDDKTENLIQFRIDECGHEICTTCAKRWFVQENNNACPLCRVRVNVANLKEQIGIIDVFKAIAEKNLNQIKKYIEEGGNINAKDEDDNTPLHHACENNLLEVVKKLVDKGADVNFQNEYGDTPLHYASSYSDLEIIECLVDNGANVNAKDKDHFTPLHYACINNNPLETVKYLVSKGADVNPKNKFGFTPLHSACRKNLLEVVKYLLNKGADVKAKDKDRSTPLDIALKYGHQEIINLLTNRTRGGGKLIKK